MKFDHSTKALQRISDKLRHQKTLTIEEEICFEDFRKGHREIMNDFQSSIRQKITSKKYKNKNIIFVQRLKRRRTILNKLSERFKTMDLIRMHDIAGGRLIFPDIPTLLQFRTEFIKSYLRRSQKYIRSNDDKFNYIEKPKDTGYRGIHDVFQEKTSKKLKAKIEIQYRTKLQHAWATTCEVWDMNFEDKTKFGLSENPDIKLFFKYISEVLARFQENQSFLKISDIDLFIEIKKLEKKYQVLAKLRKLPILKKIECTMPTNMPGRKKLLWILNKKMHDIEINTYQYIYEAIENYSIAEQKTSDDTVLVKASSKKELERAFNNYFNDVNYFFKSWKKCLDIYKESHPFRYKFYNLKSLEYNIKEHAKK